MVKCQATPILTQHPWCTVCRAHKQTPYPSGILVHTPYPSSSSLPILLGSSHPYCNLPLPLPPPLPHLEPLLPTLILLELLNPKSSDRHHVPTWRIYVTGCHEIRIPLIFGIRFALSHAENHPPGTLQIHLRCLGSLGAHSSIA